MGMFDEVQIDYQLPWPEVQGKVWQSKNTPDQHLTRYAIGSDGWLRERKPTGGMVLMEPPFDGPIECHTSQDGCWYSVVFWIRGGGVEDKVFEKQEQGQ